MAGFGCKCLLRECRKTAGVFLIAWSEEFLLDQLQKVLTLCIVFCLIRWAFFGLITRLPVCLRCVLLKDQYIVAQNTVVLTHGFAAGALAFFAGP
jgi:hypothetical protein